VAIPEVIVGNTIPPGNHLIIYQWLPYGNNIFLIISLFKQLRGLLLLQIKVSPAISRLLIPALCGDTWKQVFNAVIPARCSYTPFG
jgi:hypothetical protein